MQQEDVFSCGQVAEVDFGCRVVVFSGQQRLAGHIEHCQVVAARLGGRYRQETCGRVWRDGELQGPHRFDACGPGGVVVEEGCEKGVLRDGDRARQVPAAVCPSVEDAELRRRDRKGGFFAFHIGAAALDGAPLVVVGGCLDVVEGFLREDGDKGRVARQVDDARVVGHAVVPVQELAAVVGRGGDGVVGAAVESAAAADGAQRLVRRRDLQVEALVAVEDCHERGVAGEVYHSGIVGAAVVPRVEMVPWRGHGLDGVVGVVGPASAAKHGAKGCVVRHGVEIPLVNDGKIVAPRTVGPRSDPPPFGFCLFYKGHPATLASALGRVSKWCYTTLIILISTCSKIHKIKVDCCNILMID